MNDCNQHRRTNRELLQHPLLLARRAHHSKHPVKIKLLGIEGRRIAKLCAA